MKTYLKLCVPLLFITMACAFVQNMIVPPSPTPTREIPTPSQTVSPAPTSIPLPTATPASTVEVFNNPAPITCVDDNCLDACLDRLDTVLEAKPLEPIGNAIYEEQGAEFNLVIYQVDGDKITDPTDLYVPSDYRKYQQDTEAHLRIWNFYIAVIPPELRSTIRTFIVFTDGPEDTTAWVSRDPGETDYSQVGFDLLDSSYPPYLANTLIHETAHLLTLNSSQVPRDKDHLHYYDEKKKAFFECEQYVADGDCSLPTSYINLFYQSFWKSLYAEWWKVDKEAENTANSDEYWDIFEKFYDKHEDQFLNPYASTSVEEDMAESFAEFVLSPKPSSVKWIFQKKIAFYYRFPELVKYRRQMIEGLCSYVR